MNFLTDSTAYPPQAGVYPHSSVEEESLPRSVAWSEWLLGEEVRVDLDASRAKTSFRRCTDWASSCRGRFDIVRLPSSSQRDQGKRLARIP